MTDKQKKHPMTDHHLHIGQFNEVYYDALELFQVIESLSPRTGITEVHYSSTSSCRDDAELSGVEEEISYAQKFESKILTARPYLWFIPRYAEQGISAESAAGAFDYCGVKLHPAGQVWDEEKPAHKKALHQIFRWADDNKKSVLIHCGPQKCDLPSRFEPFFREYTGARIILAHSNPVAETARLVNELPNVFCDTACIEEKNLSLLMKKVRDKSKILFGSDFPVSHYWNTHLFEKAWSLEEEYLHDCGNLKFF